MKKKKSTLGSIAVPSNIKFLFGSEKITKPRTTISDTIATNKYGRNFFLVFTSLEYHKNEALDIN